MAGGSGKELVVTELDDGGITKSTTTTSANPRISPPLRGTLTRPRPSHCRTITSSSSRPPRKRSNTTFAPSRPRPPVCTAFLSVLRASTNTPSSAARGAESAVERPTTCKVQIHPTIHIGSRERFRTSSPHPEDKCSLSKPKARHAPSKARAYHHHPHRLEI
ncbi:hypothetical protein B0H12DRAFT_43092 [Mycena haematopus]|nr:hypothetical protein B0H12DRAFT_43092 [Mycena haematopus]